MPVTPAGSRLTSRTPDWLRIRHARAVGQRPAGVGDPQWVGKDGGMTFHADEYQAAPGRYEAGMPYRRVGRSGLDLRPSRSASGTTSATTCRSSAAGHAAPGVRPGGHPLRPGEQLRAALRLGRAQLRQHLRARLPALPRRARHLEQGGLRHVARPLRPGRRVAQVPHRLVRPVAAADGPGLRRHLLQPPLRRDDAARGDDGRARRHRPPGQGALRRHLVVLGRAHPGGGRDPPLDGHAAAHPPAVVLDAQPLDRGGPARRPRRDRRRASSRSRRSPRGC